MLSRRKFIAGSIALAGCTAYVPKEPLLTVNLGERTAIITHALELFGKRDYREARAYLESRRYVLKDPAQNLYSLDSSIGFLYAMTFLPGNYLANALNGNYETAGNKLETIIAHITTNPLELEELQDSLGGFFALPAYRDSKKLLTKLTERKSMLAVLVALVEEDYALAQQSLRVAQPHLTLDERRNTENAFFTLLQESKKKKQAATTDGARQKYDARERAYMQLIPVLVQK